jgi:glutathione S-transferase
MDALVLHTDGFWISPYVYSVFVALHEKGLKFETRLVPLQDKAQERPEYRDRSLTGRVPSLEHGDFFLAESSAIVEYLEDVFPTPPVLPRDVKQRARARQIMAWVRSDLMPIREERSTHSIFYAPSREPLTKAGVQAAERLLRAADLLIADGRTALFDAFSIADADLALMLQRLILNGHEVRPKIRRFVEAVWERPSVRAFVERERPTYVPY